MTTFDDTEVVNRRAAQLSLRLAEADVPPRPVAFPGALIARRAARRVAMRWQVAAAIALLVAGAAGVPPVRAWIVGTVHSAWLRVTGRTPPSPAPASAEPPAVTMGQVSFAAMDPLTVRLAMRQVAGTLTLRAGDTRDVSVAITGEPNAAELVVRPDGVAIVNRRASTAGYVVTVPEGLSRIVVQLGQERARVFRPPPPGDRYVVDLGVRTAPRGTLKQ